MDEIELINHLEKIEALISKGDSVTQRMFLSRVITRFRAKLDELYDREYAQQIYRDPSLVGKVFPRLSNRSG